jgi:hypothetical protein
MKAAVCLLGLALSFSTCAEDRGNLPIHTFAPDPQSILHPSGLGSTASHALLDGSGSKSAGRLGGPDLINPTDSDPGMLFEVIELPPADTDVRSATILQALNKLTDATCDWSPVPTDQIAQPRVAAKTLLDAFRREFDRSQLLKMPLSEGESRSAANLLGAAGPDRAWDDHLIDGFGLASKDLAAEMTVQEYAYARWGVTHEDIPVQGAFLLAVWNERRHSATIRGSVPKSCRDLTYPSSPISVKAIDDRVIAALRAADIRVLGEPHTAKIRLIWLREILRPAQKSMIVYARPVRVQARYLGRTESLLLMVDSVSGRILTWRIAPSDPIGPPPPMVRAEGLGWIRDPSGPREVRRFLIDDPAARGGQPGTLRLSGAVAIDGDGPIGTAPSIRGNPDVLFYPVESSSERTLAYPAQDGANYSRVNLFSLLQWYRDQTIGMGAAPQAFTARYIDYYNSNAADCTSNSNLEFGTCPGYRSSKYPDGYVRHPAPEFNYLQEADDETLIAHEVGHILTNSLTTERPSAWCGSGLICPSPADVFILHDLADVWSDHFANTNCIASWAGRNTGGSLRGVDCAHHHEDDTFPRLYEVRTPFDAGRPGDHFPEHRDSTKLPDPYADMQIAAAALWEVRRGVRSLDWAVGHVWYASHLVNALTSLNPAVFQAGSNDRSIYDGLRELELELVRQSADFPGHSQPGSEPTAKVIAGFAKAGIFLVDSNCLLTAAQCPAGDAVIDVELDPGAAASLGEGQPRMQSIYFTATGPRPQFQIWTGPRFRFDREGSARPVRGIARCYSQFRVELSIDRDFHDVYAGTGSVNVDNSKEQETPCFGVWSPDDETWRWITSHPVGTRLYYRAITSGVDGNEARSTLSPAAGTWSLCPPSIVLANAPSWPYAP